MKRFLGAVALACVFSVSALAGDVPTSGSPAPTASSSSVVTTVILTIISLVIR